MKLIYILISIFSLSNATSIYDFEVTTIDENTIKLSTYNGSKIIIYEFDALHIDSVQLKFLDSIQKSNTTIRIIAVPAIEFGSISIPLLKSSLINLNLSFPIIQPLAVKKTSLANQNSLFKWITDVNQNTHFNHEIINPGEMFIVTEKGTLYAIINANTPKSIINQAIFQNINE